MSYSRIVIQLDDGDRELIRELIDVIRGPKESNPKENPFLSAHAMTLNGIRMYTELIAYKKTGQTTIEVHYMADAESDLCDKVAGEFCLYDKEDKTIFSFFGRTKNVGPEENGWVMGVLAGIIG